MAEIISIANQKGGVGKTTTAINLAYGLACLNQEVLLVDFDPQGNATSGLGVDLKEGDKTIYELASNMGSFSQAIRQTSNELLDVLPANNNLAGLEVEIVGMKGRENVLKNILEPLKKMYKFIIIDCPPSLGLLTLNALVCSDSVITPIQAEYYAMEGLAHFIDTTYKIKKHINPQLKIDGGVVTMFDARMNLGRQVKDEVFKFFGDNVYKTAIPRNVRLAEAPGFAQSVFSYDPGCRGARAYFELAKEFLIRRGAKVEHYEEAVPYQTDTSLSYDFGG
ncbi:MAG: ParA family protein [Elusimicrobiaceae bacterium]|jgi:chromosome partitioning protein|nr:ParA family protein [Elusimicrobiaceae bacterium]MBT3954777.1 ParA family protein [Elusimicrobiaceae bacterium]MBT4008708.1 ParA family protein [Elusimicrobiaceae bacterium]MBT4403343.1 ParA family protein [Elusimicrobiaceae bacterium]MBT4439830.1 ParA family protein [Elusimicrobiaceae bacterium]